MAQKTELLPENKTFVDSLSLVIDNEKLEAKERLNAFKHYILFTLYNQTGTSLEDLMKYAKMSIRFKDSVRVSHAYHCLFYYYRKQENYDSALHYNTLMYNTANAINSEYFMASSLNNAALIQNDFGNVKEAQLLLEKALKVASDSNEFIMETRSRINLGENYKKEGNYLEAIRQFQIALAMAEDYGAVGYLASIHLSLGELSHLMYDYEQSATYFEAALDWSEKRNNRNTERSVLRKYFKLLKDQSKNDELKLVLNRYKKSIEITDLDYEKAIFKHFQSDYFLEQKKTDSARSLALEALYYFEKLNLPSELSNSYSLVAKSYLFEKNYQQAINYSLKANELSQKLKDIELQADHTYILYQANEALGNHSKALEFYKIHQKHLESLNDKRNLSLMVKKQMQGQFLREKQRDSILAANQLAIAELNYQKDLDRRKLYNWAATIISLLLLVILGISWKAYKRNKASSEKVEKQKNALEKSDEQKTILLKEIHHRVKNNLQIICSLLEIQSMNSNDQKISDLLVEGQNRVKSMALIHQNLYQFDDMSSIDFEQYVENLTNHLSASYRLNNLEIIQNLMPLKLDIDTAIPLGLILNELISNAFKHAFTNIKQPKLKIKLKKIANEEYQLSVEDNGNGIKSEQSIDQMHSTGIQLIHGLTRQLFGTFNYNFANGSQFIIRFKTASLRNKIA